MTPSPSGYLKPQASAYTKTGLPAGAQALVVADRELWDRYGCYLLYLWRADGPFVNEAIVATGHGRAVLYEPNDAYIGRIRAAEAAAKLAGQGLWQACSGTRPTPSPTPTRPTTSCDPAYPTVCIPPPPPDLDCKDVPYRNFEVLTPDPHRFDFDGDGGRLRVTVVDPGLLSPGGSEHEGCAGSQRPRLRFTRRASRSLGSPSAASAC